MALTNSNTLNKTMPRYRTDTAQFSCLVQHSDRKYSRSIVNPPIRPRLMALYKCALIDWLIEPYNPGARPHWAHGNNELARDLMHDRQHMAAESEACPLITTDECRVYQSNLDTSTAGSHDCQQTEECCKCLYAKCKHFEHFILFKIMYELSVC